VLAVLLAGLAAAQASAAACDVSMQVEWQDFRMDLARDRTVLSGVTVTQPAADCNSTMTLRADRTEVNGSDVKLNSGTLIFSGHVVMTMADGELRADSANVEFAGRRMTKATVSGVPATFLQTAVAPAGDGGNARGQAGSIVFSVASGEIEFVGDALFSNDTAEVRHPRIIYNIPQRTVRAGSGSADATVGDGTRGSIKLRRKPAGAGS
jgi:lipopolysaccharide transport protein LptA